MTPIQTTKMSNFRWVICALLFLATTVNYMDRQVLSLTWKDFIAVETSKLKPSKAMKGDVSYLRLSGSAGGSSIYTEIYAIKNGMRIGPMELRCNEVLPCERQDLTVEIVNGGRQEQQRTDDPTEIGHLGSLNCRHNVI